ncbi:uncharacterized protein LOC142640196 [Castanea sativa]|uniref:uncharacterized protein LOC142640196 n=1 Tax=Castanea sativa TaxID=21020 RepID=UPI003F64CA29
MPFGLKNVGATYQRMMMRMFRDRIGRTVEEYIDDMVIKSKQEGQHVDDLKEVFEILRRHRLRLNAECEKAFQDLKDYLRRAPTLTAPEPGEDLYMYLLASEHVASTVLLKDNGVQLPVYYVSKTLIDTEMRYLPLEKLVLAFVHSNLKLPHYFQAHTVYVLTEYPLQSLLRISDFTGRIVKWGTRLGSFDIRYRPRNSVKGQVLADFIVEFSSKGIETVCLVGTNPWKVFVDGASNAAGARARARIVVITPEGIRLKYSFRLGFRASNNEVEYKALLAGLRVVSDLGAREVEIYSDSQLVVNQVLGSFEAKYPRMVEYLRIAKRTMGYFSSVKVEQVAKGQNRHVDSLATLASSIANMVPRLIIVELVNELSISVRTVASQVTIAGRCCMDPIIKFLAENRVPDDEKEAARVRRNSSRYWLSADRKLYRSHVGGSSLAHRAMTQGFWWLQMQKEAIEYWVEAKALANIQDVDVKKFVRRNIVTRFGVPESFVFDNGSQFDSKAFREFCSNLGIKSRYSTQAYPQSNGQAEATNKAIVNGLKKRLEVAKGNWAEELPSILWAYWTTLRRSTGETPFSLTSGAEAVIPAEINLCNSWVAGFAPAKNEELMFGQLNLLEKHREAATIRLAEYQQKLARRYDRSVRKRVFTAGDLVLRKVVGNMQDINAGKLAPSWEGPYRVIVIVGAGAYYLEDLEERPLLWPWNVYNLKKFYH